RRIKARRISLAAPRALITLPLGVLQASSRKKGAVRFAPPLPADKRVALRKLAMGRVVRVTLRFRERFWDNFTASSGGKDQSLSHMNFLFSTDPWFPTWWTAFPQRFPILVGWAPFRCADRLSGRSLAFVTGKALRTLSRLLPITRARLADLLEEVYFHDWQGDPFARGAYSYVKVGGEGAQKLLAAPIERTLFFAGEATDTSGHNGTVHGAIASGLRAAKEILRRPRIT
ncbi:MAG: FAD-dependent oxidoreductase, partial [Acidobacteriales bacterium]|nr:FAD-dependent oxidoreductase [Terriglobales bacterium]